MNEPAWIDHDGSGVCPVPDGHDVERKYAKTGFAFRDSAPEQGIVWRKVTHYRDWTAFEQQQAQVPEWAIRRARYLLEKEQGLGIAGHVNRAFARYIAQHEQPPRDKLWDVATAMVREYYEVNQTTATDDMARALRKVLPAAAIKAIEEMGDE